MYCKKCGGKIESYASHCPFCGEPIENNSVQSTYTASSTEMERSNKSIGGWILTYIIMGIPLIGLIMMFVWAFGEKTKADPTFRNWAKAELLILLIATILSSLAMFLLIPVILEAMEGALTTQLF